MSKIRPLSIIISAILISASSLASAGEFEIKKNSVTLGGKKFFRYSAQEVSLGDWGRKRSPVVGKRGLDRVDSLRPALKGNVKKSGLYTAKNVSKSSLNVKGSFSVPTDAWGLEGDDFFELVKEKRCKFREVHVENLSKLAKEINEKKRWINAMKEHNDARVVTSAIYVTECQLTQEMIARHQGKFNGLLKGQKLEIVSDAALEKSDVIEIPSRAVIAYALHAPKWDKKQKKNRTKIVSWTPDKKGFK